MGNPAAVLLVGLLAAAFLCVAGAENGFAGDEALSSSSKRSVFVLPEEQFEEEFVAKAQRPTDKAKTKKKKGGTHLARKHHAMDLHKWKGKDITDTVDDDEDRYRAKHKNKHGKTRFDDRRHRGYNANMGRQYVKKPGYVAEDSHTGHTYLDKGHYYLGGSRRRIGAGFGRRRRTYHGKPPKGWKKKEHVRHKMLRHKLPGVVKWFPTMPKCIKWVKNHRSSRRLRLRGLSRRCLKWAGYPKVAALGEMPSKTWKEFKNRWDGNDGEWNDRTPEGDDPGARLSYKDHVQETLDNQEHTRNGHTVSWHDRPIMRGDSMGGKKHQRYHPGSGQNSLQAHENGVVSGGDHDAAQH